MNNTDSYVDFKFAKPTKSIKIKRYKTSWHNTVRKLDADTIRKVYERDWHKCIICWEEFIKKVHNQLTCSFHICKLARWRNLLKEKLNDPIYKENLYKKKKEFAKIDYEKHKERYILNSKKLRYNLICIKCWKEFKWYRTKLKTCSKECQLILLKEQRIWENNPAYRNWMYKKWNNNFDHHYKRNEFIKNCKIQNEEMESKYWYRFCQYCWTNNSLRWEHHHIIFRSEKPKHENLHHINNIIHLCINCHNLFHKQKSIRDPIVEERKLIKLFY